MATQSPSSIPPGPRTGALGGSLWAFRRDPLKFLGESAGFGDVSCFRFGPQWVYLVNHPDLVRELIVARAGDVLKSPAIRKTKRVLGRGLLTSEGELHKRQLALAQPAFHPARVAGYADVTVRYAEQMSREWADGSQLDLHAEMMRLTLAVVAKSLFDAELDVNVKKIARSVSTCVDLFDRAMMPWFKVFDYLPLPKNFAFLLARRRLFNIVAAMVAERRRRPGDRGDFLSILLGESAGTPVMSDRQVRDEAITIFLAGHETTAIALTFTWYALARNPQAAAALYEEIDRVLPDRPPAESDLPRLPITRMIVTETLRLYPPVWTLGRELQTDVQFGGYTIPAKSLVLASQYVLQRDERFFPDPLRFDPMRWAAEASANRPKYAYFPFGAGPRHCIGEAFAMMELVLAVATIARHWKMELAANYELSLRATITVRPHGGMPMVLQRRSKIPKTSVSALA